KLRHTTPWTPTPATQNEPPGWISPSGRRYRSEHQDWEPPHWPTQLNQPDLLKQPAGPRGGPPDFVHLRVSLGEDGLERFLHALA
ncbi:MAG: endonuclease, partial [Cellulosimicrobium cellulans]